MIYIAPIS